MYLVTGAAGHLGQAVIHHLLTTYKVPAAKIIAVTRHTDKLAELAAKGVQVRAGDFNDEAGLVKAFTGATRLLIISTDAMAPGERQKQHLNAVHAAEKSWCGPCGLYLDAAARYVCGIVCTRSFEH